jgi:hypothetical protein
LSLVVGIDLLDLTDFFIDQQVDAAELRYTCIDMMSE